MDLAARPGQPGVCTRPHCHAPDTRCLLGLDECEHFAPPIPPPAHGELGEGHTLPWSGLALGTSDLSRIAALGRVRVLATVGAANAGKTTLLAAHWVALRRGIGAFSAQFAGSYSMTGWHQIARHLQLVPYGRMFPPHTTAPDKRSPALLHVATTAGRADRTHLLYTDAPGEWFSEWAADRDRAPGAEWIAKVADAFIILADSEALSGADRGAARGEYDMLAHRLASTAGGRPVIPVQTKADLSIPPAIQGFLDSTNRRLFSTDTLRVSARSDGQVTITEPIDRGLQAALTPRHARSDHASVSWARQLAPSLRRGSRR
ncbi:MAG TPA: hypothetical protein VNS81_08540 [Nocardioides sp.]|nr:hypothetical protein [Nocardioides sp.]